MHLIVCVEERGGMAFLGRRLSWDSAVHSDIVALSEGKRIWMNAYTARKYGCFENMCVAEDFMDRAGEDDLCFAETVQPRLPVRALTVYRWNRRYPSDLKLPPEALEGLRLTATKEFAGSSHERITREDYCR